MVDFDVQGVLTDLQYTLLPGKCPPRFPQIDLYNKAYSYWKTFWAKFFEDNGMAGALTKDDFLRQDVVALITYGDEIVAMHLYSLFNIRCMASLEHSYFTRSFSAEYIDELHRRDVQSTMSYEWLTVDPKWRKSKTRFSFGLVNIVLGAHVQHALKIDAGIAVSRNDVKVTQAAIDLGWDVLVPQVLMHGKPCDLVALSPGKGLIHPIQEVNEVSQYLWENKIDLTGKFHEPLRIVRKAA